MNKNTELSENVKYWLKRFDLYKNWNKGSDTYPNIINAWIDGNYLMCEYLQLDGWTSQVFYEIGKKDFISYDDLIVTIMELRMDNDNHNWNDDNDGYFKGYDTALSNVITKLFDLKNRKDNK